MTMPDRPLRRAANAAAALSLALSGLMGAAYAQKEEPVAAGSARELGELVSFGSASAPVTIDVFYSPICSHCAHTMNELAPRLVARAEAGEIRVRFNETIAADDAFRHDIREMGALEIIALHCAPEAVYLPLARELTTRIPNINASPDPVLLVYEIAGHYGLDAATLDACRADPAMGALVETRTARLTEAGVRGAPSLRVLPTSISACDYGPGARPAYSVSRESWLSFLDEASVSALAAPADIDAAIARVRDWDLHAEMMGMDASCAAYQRG